MVRKEKLHYNVFFNIPEIVPKANNTRVIKFNTFSAYSLPDKDRQSDTNAPY